MDHGNVRATSERHNRGPVTETELPVTLPAKPKDVEFNPFLSVLAETKTEGWKGS